MEKIILILLITFSLSSVSGQQSNIKSEIPNTPAGNQLKHWLQIFKEGNQDRYEKYISNSYSKSLLEEDRAIDLADRQARRYVDARSYIIRSIEKSIDEEIAVLAQAELTGLWFRVTMKIEAMPPHLITEYTAQRIQPPPGSSKKLSEKEFVKEVESFMNNLSKSDAFSGTLLIAKNNKIIFKNAYGLASKGYNIPNRIDTKLNIASVGKIFTAIAIAQLMEQGKLSLTDTIGKFLPDYPTKQVSERVTIHHLLTHSSGLGDYHGPGYICRKGILRKVKDYFPLFDHDTLLFEPGERCQYSNAGYILLGAIIENVSGENYFDYVYKNIFKPAGMINTGYFEADRDTLNLATGYTNFEDQGDDYFQFRLGPRRNTSLYNGAKGIPAGGAFSTAEDLFRFSLALKGNKLLSAETFKLMTTNKIFFRKYDAGDTYYGYGFELETINGQRMMGHGGGDLGISSGIRMYPDSGDYTVIVLSNYDRGGIITIFKIQEMITQQ